MRTQSSVFCENVCFSERDFFLLSLRREIVLAGAFVPLKPVKFYIGWVKG